MINKSYLVITLLFSLLPPLAIAQQTPTCDSPQAKSLTLEILARNSSRASSNADVRMLSAIIGRDVASPFISLVDIKLVKFDKESGFRACVATAKRADDRTTAIGYTVMWSNKVKGLFAVDIKEYDYVLDTYSSGELRASRVKEKAAAQKIYNDERLAADIARKESERQDHLKMIAENDERMLKNERNEYLATLQTIGSAYSSRKDESEYFDLMMNQTSSDEFKFVMAKKNSSISAFLQNYKYSKIFVGNLKFVEYSAQISYQDGCILVFKLLAGGATPQIKISPSNECTIAETRSRENNPNLMFKKINQFEFIDETFLTHQLINNSKNSQGGMKIAD